MQSTTTKARLISAEAQQRLPIRLAQDEIATRAQEAVTFARDNAVEREAVADMRQVITDALRRNLGRTTVEAVTTELRLRQSVVRSLTLHESGHPKRLPNAW
jgi:hypothetical protein